MSPQKSFHSPVIDLLVLALRAAAPETLRVRREMSVVPNTRNRPDSEERDRKRIPHFWRVEKGEGRLPVVHVSEREPATGAYVATGIHHDGLKVSVPFAVDIDLSGIDRL